MEVVACLILINERGYVTADIYRELYEDSEKLSAKLLAMKNYLKKSNYTKEAGESFNIED